MLLILHFKLRKSLVRREEMLHYNALHKSQKVSNQVPYRSKKIGVGLNLYGGGGLKTPHKEDTRNLYDKISVYYTRN